jgi:hypothetical protein
MSVSNTTLCTLCTLWTGDAIVLVVSKECCCEREQAGQGFVQNSLKSQARYVHP